MTFQKKKKTGGRHRRRGIMRRFHKPKPAILPILGVGVGLYGGANVPLAMSQSTNSGKVTVALDQLSQSITGYSFVNQQMYAGNLQRFWVPTVVGAVGHIAAAKLGLNRALSSAGVPFRL